MTAVLQRIPARCRSEPKGDLTGTSAARLVQAGEALLEPLASSGRAIDNPLDDICAMLEP